MSNIKIYFYLFFISLSVQLSAQLKSETRDSLTYETYRLKIENFVKKQDWQQAIDLSNEVVSKIQMPKWQIKALLLKVRAYRMPGKFDEAIKNSKKALKLAEQHQFKKLKADVLFELANIHRDSGQKDAAIDDLAQSLVIYESVNDQKDLIKAQILKGIIQNELGDYNLSENGIKIYPNSNTGQFYIIINKNEVPASVKIYDVTGKLLKKSILNKDKNIINMQDYAKGVYLLQIKCNEHLINSQIIKR